MLDPVINSIATVIGWIRGTFSSIADFFDNVASYAAKIPTVGSYLASLFSSIANFFDNVSANVYNFGYYLKNGLNYIDDWLDKLSTLWSAVYGWISDKLDDAYYWAQQAIDKVADLADDVADLLYTVFTSIPKKFDSVWTKINTLLTEVFTYIPGKFSSLWDKINQLITEVFTYIPGKFSSVWTKINTLLTEVFTYIPGKLSSLWDKINTIITELFTSIPKKFSSVWDKVNTLITAVFTSIPGKISSILDTIAALPALLKDEILQAIRAEFNLVSFFFEDIADFFSDPWGWLGDKFENWFFGPEK